ncbi:putative MFS family arabinose efflux permease [Micromonospora kangleipakensis]|uniref:Putative MFS family arabinose efflux permease n=1 Tax=Micromonospora kangleipakensis TaxID=1077942 RepID=A0A4V6MGS8_9ACTN|nr:YbfB/YjiJ family MFS transporter [Micromonospora kangleipakensis]RZU74246.1 putative MFS family arabinose efflux permease [Micromonospora kangleipakensis]
MSPNPRRREALIALGLAAGPVVALGFTRFAYALLLPAMRGDLHWTYAQAGGLNTANAAGYVIGAGTAVLWARRLGDRAAFAGALAVSALALLLTGTTADYPVLSLLRFVGGLATAVSFVLGSALAARVAAGGGQRRAALLVALYMAGVGIGVVLSGLLVPAALAVAGDAGWRAGWLLLGVVAVLAVGPAVLAVRRVPAVAGRTGAGLPRADLARLAPTFAWYVLFGAGYVSYMTFVIALLRDQGLGTAGVATFFVVLGLASAVATLTVWGRVIGRLPGGRGPALVSVLVLVGVLPVLLLPAGLPAALVSAAVFGSSFMAGPTAATVLARRTLPAGGWTAGIALLTVAFSVGQAVGPLVSGALSDSGGVAVGLWLSVGLLAAAALVALRQRDTVPAEAPEPVAALRR